MDSKDSTLTLFLLKKKKAEVHPKRKRLKFTQKEKG